MWRQEIKSFSELLAIDADVAPFVEYLFTLLAENKIK